MTWRVHVRILPRAGLLDPQGQAVEHALSALHFPEASNVHVGKAIALDVTVAEGLVWPEIELVGPSGAVLAQDQGAGPGGDVSLA